MTALVRIGIAMAVAGCIAGCATAPVTVPSAVVTSPRTKVIPAARVSDAVAIGKSTKADVAAALGQTLAISFDTGFELWVYRLDDGALPRQTLAQRITGTGSEKAAAGTSGEFVILFAPSGLVAKTRIRPAPRENGVRLSCPGFLGHCN
jgi:hypothetical protein